MNGLKEERALLPNAANNHLRMGSVQHFIAVVPLQPCMNGTVNTRTVIHRMCVESEVGSLVAMITGKTSMEWDVQPLQHEVVSVQ